MSANNANLLKTVISSINNYLNYQCMKTHSKNGNPTAYGFACGYIQRQTKLTKETNARLLTKELYKEGGVYHVRQFNDSTRILWDSFHTLAEAKISYNKIQLS